MGVCLPAKPNRKGLRPTGLPARQTRGPFFARMGGHIGMPLLWIIGDQMNVGLVLIYSEIHYTIQIFNISNVPSEKF